ncbi:MAG TPA: ATP-binding cassette domain-containing protein [Solirubrobacter sp.]|nr:ATP-binding cassette domain-containing protein [Solirubrobacter sp.]
MIRPDEIVALVGHDGGPARMARELAAGHAGRVGYVPAGRRVFASLTVDENLRVGAYRRPKDGRLERVYARFPRLRERAAQPAGTLSGGEQQLLVIARALIGEPDLLILDDPSAGLAPPAVQAVADALRGLTVVIADEKLTLARAAADRIVLIEHDAVVLDLPKAQALEDERLGPGYLTGSSSTA